MRTLRWVFALSFAGVCCAGTAGAQTTLTSGVQQPGSIRQMAFQSDDYGYPTVADPVSAAPASPSNAPPAPPAPPAATGGTAAKPAAEAPKEAAPADAPAADAPAEQPYRIFHNLGNLGEWEDCHHLELRGFIDAGYTVNPSVPTNNYNGPVGFNDRANEGQLNQLYLTAERLTKVENDCGIDYG